MCHLYKRRYLYALYHNLLDNSIILKTIFRVCYNLKTINNNIKKTHKIIKTGSCDVT
jgi:hypothetical protein